AGGCGKGTRERHLEAPQGLREPYMRPAAHRLYGPRREKRPLTSDWDPALIKRLRKLLNRARVIPEAPAMQLGRVGRSHPGSRAPSSSGPSTLDRIGERLRNV